MSFFVIQAMNVRVSSLFSLSAVVDPRTGKEISLDRAVSLGIINQTEGKYVNPWTRESIPIPTAMNAGKIKVCYTPTVA